MKDQIIDLWKISFNDTDDFMRLWFDRVYKDEQTFVIRKNGQIVSALQILPYKMTYCGTTIPAGYICGVCTLPSERGKGYMTQLMHKAINEMKSNYYALAFLIPATTGLFDLYRRFSFTNAFDYAIEEVQFFCHFKHHEPMRNIEFQRIVSHDDLSSKIIYPYYHTTQKAHDCIVLHSTSQYETICLDHMLGGGEIWVAYVNDQPVGVAFSSPEKDQSLPIREIMCHNTEIKNQLIQAILNNHQLHKAKVRTLPTRSNALPYGMARIINKVEIIDLYRSFHTHSPLPDLFDMDIPSLTQTLLQYPQRQAYMNLMLD